MKCGSNVTTTTSVAVAATPRRLSLWPWVQTRGKSRYVTTTTAVAVATTLRRLSREALGRKTRGKSRCRRYGHHFTTKD
ncbi:unnamed protein product [Prunus armeniaca]|uniref:Uncharacterized protein n=1 Tax=Prunus armeniaca TaxID=36596 RepID=A0A6J5U3M7_PRUAR|nr:unnamed protein product [Prunus armeniaca]